MPKSNRGEKPWSGKFLLPQFKSRVLQMRIYRKLEDIHQDLVTLGSQGKTKGFFNNVENADKLASLVEDVRDVMIDYQVCPLNSLPFSAQVSRRRRCNRTSTTGASSSSLVSYDRISLSDLVTDQLVGIGGPYPSGQDASHPGCGVLVWEQTGVPEGDAEGCPVGGRTLVHRGTRAASLLAEWARRDRKIDHRSDGGRDGLRGRKTRGELLLLAGLR